MKNLKESFDIPSKINNILIVDDNQFNIITLDAMFDDFNLTSDHAFDGQKGIDQFIHHYEKFKVTYKLILMDIDMPIKDGFQSAQEIIQYCISNDINTNVVACTAYLSSKDMQRA